MSNRESRYEQVSRRAFMKNTLLAGAAVALVPALASCAESDEKVLAGKDTPTVPPNSTTSTAPPTTTGRATTSAPTTATSAPTTGASSPTTARPTTPTTTPATTPATTASAPAANPIPSTAKLTVDFTFAAAAGGRINNPYIAVWIENEAGALVTTVSLWYQSGKGDRYLNELRRWYSAESSYLNKGGTNNLATISSATRVPGVYSVVWNGTDPKGNAVERGNYFVCIEASREHGPYELIRQPIALADKPFTTALTPNGELTAAAVKFNV